MEELSLHILDLVENSIRAGARLVEILVDEDLERDRMQIVIWDDGQGMDEAARRRALDPFFTTRENRRIGMGLPLLADATMFTGGRVELESEPGRGTRIVATFQHGHIDRQPLGSLGDTLEALAVGNPDVDFVCVHRRPRGEWRLDTREIKKALGDEPIASADGIRMIRSAIQAQGGNQRGG